MKKINMQLLAISMFLNSTFAHADILSCNLIFENKIETKTEKQRSFDWFRKLFAPDQKASTTFTLETYLNEHSNLVQEHMSKEEFQKLPKAIDELKQQKHLNRIIARLNLYKKTLDSEDSRSAIKARMFADKILSELGDNGAIDRITDRVKDLFINVELSLKQAEYYFNEIKKLEALNQVTQQDKSLTKKQKANASKEILEKIKQLKKIATEHSYISGKSFEEYIAIKRKLEALQNEESSPVVQQQAAELQTKLNEIIAVHFKNSKLDFKNMTAHEAMLLFESNVIAKIAHKKHQAMKEFGVSARGLIFNPVIIKYFTIIVYKTPFLSKYSSFRNLVSILLGMDQQAHAADIYGTKILSVLELENSQNPNKQETQYQLMRTYTANSESENGFLISFYLNPEMPTEVWLNQLAYAKKKAQTNIDGLENSRAIYFYNQMLKVENTFKNESDRTLSSGKTVSYRSGIYLTLLAGAIYWQYADPASVAHEWVPKFLELFK